MTVCKTCHKAQVAANRKRNRAVTNRSSKAWRARNPERRRQSMMRFKARRPDLIRAADAARRQRKRQARVPWYDPAQVARYYRLAKALRAAGYEATVEHVVALHHRVASGLHVQTNLCLSHKSDNFARGRRGDPNLEPPLIATCRAFSWPPAGADRSANSAVGRLEPEHGRRRRR